MTSAIDTLSLSERAVIYLRVSSVGQVNTDYDPEGISIPAQREACRRKAAQLGVEIPADGEYVEPGRSGTNMEQRPAFQAMLERLRTERDVKYVIVYKLSRMNRNRVDDALVLVSLRRYHVTLISATESIDETPVGQLMHGILAAFNEYRSAEDGADIRYKMREKAKRGGTLGRAPIGYINVRERFEGREVRTVVIDDSRGPLVRQAFELYATGEYTLDRLQQTMADQGLSTRPTAKWPEQPVSLNTLHVMLHDPYYIGVVEYDGETYPGRHEPLIPLPLWERVQEVLDVRSQRGSRDRVNQHYLKGLLFCGRCQAAGRQHRLIYTIAKGRRGESYAYFLCRGRQEHVCELPYLSAQRVEDEVGREFARLQLPSGFADTVLEKITEVLADEQQTTRTLRRNLTQELARLDVREERLLDLAAEGTLSQVKIRIRLTQLTQDRARITDELGKVDIQLSDGAELLRLAIQLLADPGRLFQRADDPNRRRLTQTFFERLYVDDEGVSSAVLRPPFDDLAEASAAYLRPARTPAELLVIRNRRPSGAGTPVDGTKIGLLAHAVCGVGSSKTVMVEVAGIEPASFGTELELLRAQPVVLFSAPPVPQASR